MGNPPCCSRFRQERQNDSKCEGDTLGSAYLCDSCVDHCCGYLTLWHSYFEIGWTPVSGSANCSMMRDRQKEKLGSLQSSVYPAFTCHCNCFIYIFASLFRFRLACSCDSRKRIPYSSFRFPVNGAPITWCCAVANTFNPSADSIRASIYTFVFPIDTTREWIRTTVPFMTGRKYERCMLREANRPMSHSPGWANMRTFQHVMKSKLISEMGCGGVRTPCSLTEDCALCAAVQRSCDDGVNSFVF